MRIASFVPSATEILYALGLGADIVGVTHECDYPPEAKQKPALIRTTIDQEALSSQEIDQAVKTAIKERQSLYVIDEQALQRAQPELIVTQELCEVCAVDTAAVSQALSALTYQPLILSLHPHTLEESLDQLRLVGEQTGRGAEAARELARARQRLARVQMLVRGRPVRRVFCLEWLEPPMASGHWVPEMVEAAGGIEVLGKAGQSSRYVTWSEIAAAAPDVLIVMPCGLSIDRMRRELQPMTSTPEWQRLPAVQAGQVFLVDGPAYFNRSGPRLVDGVELLAGLLHPDACAFLVPPGGAQRV